MKKKKDIFFWTFVGLIIAFLIFAVIFTPIQACSKKSDGSDNPVEPGPVDPPEHQHEWTWKYTSTEHWQEATCHNEVTRNRGAHKFVVDNDNAQREKCSTCGYSRPLPTKQDDLNVSFGDDGASIGKPDDDVYIPDLVIPGTVTDPGTGEEVNVVEVKNNAYENDANLHTLIILEGVKKIGEGAFKGCSELTEIRLPSTIEEIDPQAFTNCKKLERIIVDEGNPVYRSYTNCIILISEQRIILGCKNSTVPTAKENGQFIATSIGSYAFYGSGVENIVIPDNITSIYERAFEKCTYLTEFTVPESVTKISAYAFNGCTALKTLTLHDGITEIGQNAFTDCNSLVESTKNEKKIVFPANLKTIGESAFSGCAAIKEIVFNENLTGIDRYAFNGCTALTSVTLTSSGVLGIGNSVFNGCTNLSEIVYTGTREKWNENVKTGNNWKPDSVEVTFKSSVEETPDTGDTDSSDDGTENQD